MSWMVFVEVQLHSGKLLLTVAYIPPPSLQQLYKDFVNLLDFHSGNYCGENIIFCGDFNLAGIVWDDTFSFNAVQYVAPGIIACANVLRQVSVSLNLCQLFPVHSTKGYTVDLLLASKAVCEYINVEDKLVSGDPIHHECAFFRIQCLSDEDSWHDSENKITSNFYRANYNVINTMLDMDWESILGIMI